MKKYFLVVALWILSLPSHALQCAALKAKEVNWRKGPTNDHSILWVFRCPGWPVVIEKKKNHWYFVRDHDGTQGWVQGAMLTFNPTLLVTQDVVSLHTSPSDQKRIVAYLKKGMIVRYLKHEGKKWYLVSIPQQAIKGWLPAHAVWPCPCHE
jgi:SH3-like domain-containing protein